MPYGSSLMSDFVRLVGLLRVFVSTNRYLCLMKRYYPFTGLIISLFVALLSYVLRTAREDMTSSAYSAIGSFTNTFLSWLVVQWVIQREHPRHYAWKGLLAVTGCMCISLLLFYATRDVAEIRERAEAAQRGMRAVHFLLLLRGMVIGGFLFFIAYLLRMTVLNQRSRLENERLKKENLQARLNLMQEQLSPHFLFNSLGTLRTMVTDPAPRAFIQRLADVYRYLLNSRQADMVELRQELDFVQAYLHILQERFEGALLVTLDIADHCLSMKLPPMTLQLLVENAIKHNVVDTVSPLGLSISTIGADTVTVRNSLRLKRSADTKSGTGLHNIRERYRLLTGRTIEVLQTPEEFVVSIFLVKS